MSDINFLSLRRSVVTKRDKQDAQLQKYTTIAFGVACVLFFSVAIYNFILTRQLQQAGTQQRALSQQITNNEDVEVGFLVFTQKLKSVREIYENRSNKQQAIDYFSNIFGDQVFLSGMNYGEKGKDNALSLRLTSENIFAFENTLNILDSEEVKSVFSSVSKSGLRRDDTGSYNLDIAVELKKEGDQATDANTQ